MNITRILVIEDDHDTAQLVALHLREVGYQVDRLCHINATVA